MKKTLLLSLAFILIALPALAATPIAKKATVTINKECAKTAIQNREQSLIMSHTQHQGAFNSALMNRQTALYNAWDAADAKARKAAINSAWTKFTQEKKAANKTLLKSIQSAWKTYKAEMAKCKINPADYEGKAAEGSDASLQQ